MMEGASLSSTTTQAGVEAMQDMLDHTASSMTPQDEELLLQNRILQSRSQDDRRARQRTDEELQFVKHKLADREKKLDQERKARHELYIRCQTYEKQKAQNDSAVGALKQCNAELLSRINSLEEDKAKITKLYNEVLRTQELLHKQLSVSQGSNSSSGVLSPPAGAGGQVQSSFLRRTVSEIINDKVQIKRLRRLTVGERSLREKVSSVMECQLMEQEDMDSKVMMRNLDAGIPALNQKVPDDDDEEGYDSTDSTRSWGSAQSADGSTSGTSKNHRAPLRRRHSGLVSFDAVRRSSRGAQSGYFLPFHYKIRKELKYK